MLQTTEAAKKELKRIAKSRDLGSSKNLRLAVPPVWDGPGDFGIVVSQDGNADLEFLHDGVKILLVDPALAKQLSKSVLDFKDSRFSLDVY